MNTACIVLEDVVCDAGFHRLHSRSIYPCWREIWLRKASEGQGAVGGGRGAA